MKNALGDLLEILCCCPWSSTAQKPEPPSRNLKRLANWRAHPTVEQYHLQRHISDGGFSEIWLAQHRQTGQKQCLKVVYLRKPGLRPEDAEVLRGEARLLRNLDHPSLLHCKDAFETKFHLVMVLEYLSGGELLEHVHKVEHYSEAEAARLFAQVAGAVAYMHNLNILHRDIKPENVMFARPVEDCMARAKPLRLKLIDLGMAAVIAPPPRAKRPRLMGGGGGGGKAGGKGGRAPLRGCLGSPGFIAPEVVRGGQHSAAMDVYSLGVLLCVMLTGRQPWALREVKNFQYAAQPLAQAPGLRDARFLALSPAARDLILAMLADDPLQRPTCAAVLRHAFITHGLASGLRGRGGPAGGVPQALPPPLDETIKWRMAQLASLRRFRGLSFALMSSHAEGQQLGDFMAHVAERRRALHRDLVDRDRYRRSGAGQGPPVAQPSRAPQPASVDGRMSSSSQEPLLLALQASHHISHAAGGHAAAAASHSQRPSLEWPHGASATQASHGSVNTPPTRGSVDRPPPWHRDAPASGSSTASVEPLLALQYQEHFSHHQLHMRSHGEAVVVDDGGGGKEGERAHGGPMGHEWRAGRPQLHGSAHSPGWTMDAAAAHLPTIGERPEEALACIAAARAGAAQQARAARTVNAGAGGSRPYGVAADAALSAISAGYPSSGAAPAAQPTARPASLAIQATQAVQAVQAGDRGWSSSGFAGEMLTGAAAAAAAAAAHGGGGSLATSSMPPYRTGAHQHPQPGRGRGRGGLHRHHDSLTDLAALDPLALMRELPNGRGGAGWLGRAHSAPESGAAAAALPLLEAAAAGRGGPGAERGGGRGGGAGGCGGAVLDGLSLGADMRAFSANSWTLQLLENEEILAALTGLQLAGRRDSTTSSGTYGYGPGYDASGAWGAAGGGGGDSRADSLASALEAVVRAAVAGGGGTLQLGSGGGSAEVDLALTQAAAVARRSSDAGEGLTASAVADAVLQGLRSGRLSSRALPLQGGGAAGGVSPFSGAAMQAVAAQVVGALAAASAGGGDASVRASRHRISGADVWSTPRGSAAGVAAAGSGGSAAGGGGGGGGGSRRGSRDWRGPGSAEAAWQATEALAAAAGGGGGGPAPQSLQQPLRVSPFLSFAQRPVPTPLPTPPPSSGGHPAPLRRAALAASDSRETEGSGPLSLPPRPPPVRPSNARPTYAASGSEASGGGLTPPHLRAAISSAAGTPPRHSYSNGGEGEGRTSADPDAGRYDHHMWGPMLLLDVRRLRTGSGAVACTPYGSGGAAVGGAWMPSASPRPSAAASLPRPLLTSLALSGLDLDLHLGLDLDEQMGAAERTARALSRVLSGGSRAGWRGDSSGGGGGGPVEGRSSLSEVAGAAGAAPNAHAGRGDASAHGRGAGAAGGCRGCPEHGGVVAAAGQGRAAAQGKAPVPAAAAVAASAGQAAAAAAVTAAAATAAAVRWRSPFEVAAAASPFGGDESAHGRCAAAAAFGGRTRRDT